MSCVTSLPFSPEGQGTRQCLTCEGGMESGMVLKTSTLISIRDTRKMATMVVRVEVVGVWGEEGRRRESFVMWKQVFRRHKFRDICPSEFNLERGGGGGGGCIRLVESVCYIALQSCL